MTKGYIEFFSSNPKYRRLWAATVISLLGEWFNTIALFFLILEYSGSEFLLGVLFAVRMLLFGLSQPINGLLADRLNRKGLMFWSNIAQIGLALSFILVDGPEDMWWLITVSGLMMLLHGVYVTAERAAVPNIVAEEDLITANAIGSASWSTALCTGAMLGGVVVSEFSADDTMADNATDAVPVESAVRGYVNKRLGFNHAGNVQSNPIGPGVLARDGSTSARAAQSAWEIKKTLGPAAKTGYYYLINPVSYTHLTLPTKRIV